MAPDPVTVAPASRFDWRSFWAGLATGIVLAALASFMFPLGIATASYEWAKTNHSYADECRYGRELRDKRLELGMSDLAREDLNGLALACLVASRQRGEF